MKNNEFYAVGKGIRKLIVPTERFINKCGYGEVYRIEKDRCAKIYYVKFPVKAKKDTKKVLKKIRNLNIDGMYEIYELLYDKKNLEFKGYTMKKYDGIMLGNMDQNLARRILDMPSEKAIDYLVRLQNINYVLSSNGIYMSDDLASNIIVGDESFQIIDADSFLYRPNRKEDAKKENDGIVRSLVTALPIRAALKLGMPNEELNRIRQNAKRIFMQEDITLSEQLSEIEKEKTLGKLLLK